MMNTEKGYYCDKCGSGPFTVWEIRVHVPFYNHLCEACANAAHNEVALAMVRGPEIVAEIERRYREDAQGKWFLYSPGLDPSLVWYISRA
jgi:hypothetical protein